MRLYRLGFCVGLLAFAVASCAGTALNVGAPQNANTANSPSNQNDKSDQAVFSLDLQHPEVIQKIVPGDGDPTKARFVQVEDRVDMLLNLQLAANLPMVEKK